ncbi:MAG: PAS domain-containing protein [Candidatus Sumerlaeota bacterium]|nr:PAS domain-containing protein [Candidatus Sumerlaeota bacterium]
MIKDITERKQVEAALRESRERYSTIFNQSPIAIEFYNSDGGLISVNDACIDLFGVVDRNEISGFKLFEDPNISGDIKTKLLNGENVRFEAEFNFEEVKKLNLYQTTCSGIKILDWSISPLTNGTLVIGYIEQIQDITERKQAEEALRKANEQIRLAVAVRDARDAIATTEQAADPDAEGTSHYP